MRTMWRYLLAVAVALSLSWSVSRGWMAEGDSIPFHDNYADALREAKATGKPIFLEFRCAP